SPRDQLLRLVPDDVALCLLVQDLRSHAEKLQAAPWVKRLLDSPFGKSLAAAPEMQKLTGLDAELRRTLQINLGQLRDDIFGDAVVFAFRQGPAGSAGRDQALFLLWARSDECLAALVDRVNQEQQRSGEVKGQEARDYRGVRYYRRQEAKGDHFYFVS